MQPYIVPLIVFLWSVWFVWYVHRVGTGKFRDDCTAFFCRCLKPVKGAGLSMTFRIAVCFLALALFFVGLETLRRGNGVAVSILWSAMLLCMIGIAWLTQKRSAADFARKSKLGGRKYHVENVTKTLRDALGFIKEWVTSIIQIETALLGGIGAAFILKNGSDNGPIVSLTAFDKCSLGLTALAFGYSIVYGVDILRMLPGAVQRVPINPNDTDDVHSIDNTGRDWTIGDATERFRRGFLVGLFGVAAFVMSRVIGPPFWTGIGYCADLFTR